jgi:hypothetical protein
MRNQQTMASQRRAKKEGGADMGAELTTSSALVNREWHAPVASSTGFR